MCGCRGWSGIGCSWVDPRWLFAPAHGLGRSEIFNRLDPEATRLVRCRQCVLAPELAGVVRPHREVAGLIPGHADAGAAQRPVVAADIPGVLVDPDAAVVDESEQMDLAGN